MEASELRNLCVNTAYRLVTLASERNSRISCAESCTGGMVGSFITSVPGSSKVFNGSLVSYSNEVKRSILGVRAETLDQFGAVSHQVAEEMAENALRLFCLSDTSGGNDSPQRNTSYDIAVGITGIAGPDGGSEEKPVGLVYISVATPGGIRSRKYRFHSTRAEIRLKAAEAALSLMRDFFEQ